jgi:hypothetical protein
MVRRLKPQALPDIKDFKICQIMNTLTIVVLIIFEVFNQFFIMTAVVLKELKGRKF